MKTNKRGFTLIELLTVIAILGILVLLAASKFLGYAEKANIVKIQSGIKAVETAVNLKSLENPEFTKDWVVLTPDKLREINDSGKLIDKNGFIKENLDGGKNVPLKDLDNVKWNSGGEFILSEDEESVYYYNKDINVSKKPDGSAIIPETDEGTEGGINPGGSVTNPEDGTNPGSGEGTTPTEPEPIVPVDTDGPTLSLSQSKYNSSTKKVTITATASDISGLKSIKKPNGTTSTSSPTTYVVSTNGTYTFEALDTLNNKTTRSITVSSVPAVPAPEATITGNTNTVSIINQNYSTVYSVTVITEAPIAFLAYSDNKTKEELKDYSNRMQDWQLSQGRNFSTFNVDIRKNGYYAIYVRDTAGNETYKTYPITMGIGFSETIGYTTLTDLAEFTVGTDGGTKTVSSVKAVRGDHPTSYVQSNGVNLLNGHTSVLDTGVNGTHYQVLDFFARVNGSQDSRQYKYYTLVVTYTNGETIRRLFETASRYL